MSSPLCINGMRSEGRYRGTDGYTLPNGYYCDFDWAMSGQTYDHRQVACGSGGSGSGSGSGSGAPPPSSSDSGSGFPMGSGGSGSGGSFCAAAPACYREDFSSVGLSEGCYDAIGAVSDLPMIVDMACPYVGHMNVDATCLYALLAELAACIGTESGNGHSSGSTDEPTATPPTTAEPTATPPTTAMTMEQVCAAVLCPAECGNSETTITGGIAGCGWSKSAGGCIYGGRTTGSELNIPCNTAPPVLPPTTQEPAPAPTTSELTTAVPPTTAEPTVAPPTTAMTMAQVCAAILCPAECGDSDSETRDGIAGCGWSKGSGGCINGGRTTGSELNIPCNTAPPVAPPATAEPMVPPTMPVSETPQICPEIMCPADCNPDAIPGTVCGWSRKDGASVCKEGGRTTVSELLLPCNSVTGAATSSPAVATEATVSCADIACAYLCVGSCGWSRNNGMCQADGQTSGSELSGNLALPGYIADSAARTCTAA